jgi:pimeloyl-ACP methyl ester carboxylesterase
MAVKIDRVGRADTGTPSRLPDRAGVVERDGVRVHWEGYGERGPAVLLIPAWSVTHARQWKGQIPYLARSCRVLAFDPRGNGLSDRPDDAEAYAQSEFVEDAVAVLDAAGVDAAIAVGMSLGGLRAAMLAAAYPDRVDGAFLIDPTIPFLTPNSPERSEFSTEDELADHRGWGKYNHHYWQRDYRDFLEFFFAQVFPEPHSTKHIEDSVAWGLDTTPETLILSDLARSTGLEDRAAVERMLRAIRCPAVVVHGTDDRIVPFDRGVRTAEILGCPLVRLEGSGHAPQGREPVLINLMIKDFVDRVAGPPPPSRIWRRSLARPRRALYISSPIGLGHAWRDVAIADALRRRVPGLEIEWLAQEPVTTVLRARGEHLHPASEELASEALHIDLEAGEHDLHAFEALRRMDDIFCANFMLFLDVVRDERFDVWIGDEAWEVDHFLHENPELKTAPFVWLSDFVGYLPMAAGGEREAALTADYNAEMIEHLARHPSVRDRSIFIGEPQDVVPAAFGPGLPAIRAWTEEHFAFAGYVPGFDPRTLADRAALRAQLGYGDEPVCLVSVGGSGVGAPLLRRVIAALPALRERVPGLRMLAVAGPRIDPGSLPAAEGLEVRGYVHELYRHAAACDVAVVQGGLTTTMELVAAGRPFIAMPLASHFEQRFHVRHRLDRYGARRWMDFADAQPEALADAVAGALRAGDEYAPVEAGAADRAAELIAGVL